jgi:AAA domain
MLTAILYGESGVGKTPIAATAPGRVLFLDAERGSRFLPGRRIEWDPLRDNPPESGDWDVCVVAVSGWAVAKAALDWISAGKHAFDSIIVDSLTSLQRQCREDIMAENRGKMTEAAWGVLLDEMESTLRRVLDSTTAPVNPTKCVILTAQADEKNGKLRPWVQGSLLRSLPAMVDVVAYVYVADDVADEKGAARVRMLISPMSDIVAKDRTTGLPNGGLTALLGSIVSGPINVTDMIRAVYEIKE